VGLSSNVVDKEVFLEKVRTYGCYKTLSQALSRDGIKYPGKVATLLLDTFVHGNRKIYRTDLETRKILNKTDSFTTWRTGLTHRHWLIFEQQDKYSSYSPGPNLVKFVNKEKLRSNEIASFDDIPKVNDENKEILMTKTIATVDQLEELRAELEKYKNGLRVAIERWNPPHDEEKEEELCSYLN
jgi:thymidylate synthase